MFFASAENGEKEEEEEDESSAEGDFFNLPSLTPDTILCLSLSLSLSVSEKINSPDRASSFFLSFFLSFIRSLSLFSLFFFLFLFFSPERNNDPAKSNLGIIFENFVSLTRFIASSNTPAPLINHHNDGDLLSRRCRLTRRPLCSPL